MLNLSRSYVYELLASGEIPSVTIGRCRRIRREALERWAEEREAADAGRYAPRPAPTPRRAGR